MRFMMIVKGSRESEAGAMPSEKLLADMARFNEEMINAGVMLSGDGLQPGSKGARVRFGGGKPTVTQGPFADNPTSLISGFWIIQVGSKDEAVEWAKRVPFDEGEVEVRQISELEDFGESDAIDHHARLREQLARK